LRKEDFSFLSASGGERKGGMGRLGGKERVVRLPLYFPPVGFAVMRGEKGFKEKKGGRGAVAGILFFSNAVHAKKNSPEGKVQKRRTAQITGAVPYLHRQGRKVVFTAKVENKENSRKKKENRRSIILLFDGREKGNEEGVTIPVRFRGTREGGGEKEKKRMVSLSPIYSLGASKKKERDIAPLTWKLKERGKVRREKKSLVIFSLFSYSRFWDLPRRMRERGIKKERSKFRPLFILIWEEKGGRV